MDQTQAQTVETTKTPQPLRAPGSIARKRIAAIIVLLLLSAIAFCALVVWNRDTHLKARAMEWAGSIQVWLTKYVQDRSYLPPQLPADVIGTVGALELPYPNRDEIVWLRTLDGPYVLVAGPKQGLIMPGGDGCAVVVYDHGTIRTAWMPRSEVRAEAQKRKDLVRLEFERIRPSRP